jgi:Lipid A 3-O-deacylase (PagL)
MTGLGQSFRYSAARGGSAEVGQMLGHRELTTRFLFRESIAVGFKINSAWRIIAFADHGSNGNLGYRNLGINHAGVTLRGKLGEVTETPSAPSSPSVSSFSWAGLYAGISGGKTSGRVNALINEREPDQSGVKFDSIFP